MASESIATRKLQLIAQLAKVEDEELISLIEQLLQPDASGDWATDLTASEMAMIKSGLDDLENGKTEAFEVFQKRVKAKFA